MGQKKTKKKGKVIKPIYSSFHGRAVFPKEKKNAFKQYADSEDLSLNLL